MKIYQNTSSYIKQNHSLKSRFSRPSSQNSKTLILYFDVILQILCGYAYVWHQISINSNNTSNYTKILDSAIPVGYLASGETLYACRAIHEWTYILNNTTTYEGGLYIGHVSTNFIFGGKNDEKCSLLNA